MVKQAPTLGRLLIMAGFALSCFGLLLFLWVAFGGPTPLKPQGYRFTTSFGEGTQLAVEADVRISGVSVGKVKSVTPNRLSGRSDTVIELEPRYAPVRRDTRAILRQKTLLGETYVELTPGNNSAGFVPENGRLPAGQVSPTVELDEIFRAFDPDTREAFKVWMSSLATATTDRGRDISDALGNLAPFAQDTNDLLRILNSQSSTVRRLVRNGGEVFEALSERDTQLAQLITNSNRVFETTARRDQELADTFRVLPTFNREAAVTVRRLTSFARKADPLVTQLRPAARQLSPTLIDLKELAPDLKALFRDLDPLITASKKGLPATQQLLDDLKPFLGASDPVLRQLNPILSFLGRYKEEGSAFFANVVGATQASNIPPGGDVTTKTHYLRTTNPLNAENLAVYPRRIGTNRPNPYPLPGAFSTIKDGLKLFEDRHCKNGIVPALGGATDGLLGLLPAPLRDNVVKYVFGGAVTSVAAPPCVKQGQYTVGGKTTDFPQVAASTGATAGASRSK
ncbi:MlaD family protein [Paraconexibacter sp.]|uniref:MlaD family protein n=1 Tax=Paraconexibacter sp. TaxID=2949640 RepID=UPI003565F965